MPSLDGVFVPVTTPFRGDDVAPDRLADTLRGRHQGRAGDGGPAVSDAVETGRSRDAKGDRW